MLKKDFLSIRDLDRGEFGSLFSRAGELKKMRQDGTEYAPLKGKTLGMIFYKSSTRTRLSFEVGMYQLGGMAIFLSHRDIQLGRGEAISDTAKIMSRYLDAVMIRTFSQESLEEFARYSQVPVINGLTDLLHPCQILSDLFTIYEKKGSCEDLRVAYIGDGNNIANTWIDAATRLRIELALACPEGYEPDAQILKRGRSEALLSVDLFRSPQDAVKDADVIYTDVWTSMGQESEREQRLQVFREYQVNEKLLKKVKPSALVMHCLPAHRGEEITSGVIDGPQSIVLDQAENRLHVQKAIMEILIGGKKKQ